MDTLNTNSSTDTSRPPDSLKLIAELLRTEMGFPVDPPRVFVYNSGYVLPPDDGVFLTVGLVAVKPYGHSLDYRADQSAYDLTEVQTIHVRETISVDIFSKTTEARVRMHEIPFSLRSTASQQMQERYAIRAFFIPSGFVDASGIEASARLNRFRFTFALIRAYERITAPAFFDKFQLPPEIHTNP